MPEMRREGLIVSLNSETGDYGHSGGAPGISNYTRYFSEQEMLIMIMMNKESSRDVRNVVLEHYHLFDNR